MTYESIGHREVERDPRRISHDELHDLDAYWRACNYLALGMLYLRDNPLLREPLAVEHLKQRLVGHWGSAPGQSFVWVHLNRLIKKYDLNAIYIAAASGVNGPQRLDDEFARQAMKAVPDHARFGKGLGSGYIWARRGIDRWNAVSKHATCGIAGYFWFVTSMTASAWGR